MSSSADNLNNKANKSTINGIINILKPPNMTSHDVVGFLRRITRIKKIGHTGTLDPNAAGVLPVCIGKATRVAEYFNLDDIRKKYRAEITLGASTDTQDSYGSIIKEVKDINIAQEEFEQVLNKYIGEIEQIPPMYSAKKVGGKKLYELARQGIEVERKKRIVNIYDIDLISSYENSYLFDVECSSGTYVRTICNDIGEDLGTMGYMSFLLRTEVGPFNLDNALTLKEVEDFWNNGELNSRLFSMDYPLSFMEELIIDESCLEQILNGVKLPLNRVINREAESLAGISEEKDFRVYCGNRFIGVGGIRKSIIKMKKVLFDSKDGI